MSLLPVTLRGIYFSRNGQRFVPIGAPWVPAKAALQWPLQWDETEIKADFPLPAHRPLNSAVVIGR